MIRSYIARSATGFTLVEMLIAIVLLALVFVSLEGGSATLMRALGVSGRMTVAAQLVEWRGEHTAATRCVAATGADSARGIVSIWRVEIDSSGALLDQETTYRSAMGMRTDRARWVVPCL